MDIELSFTETGKLVRECRLKVRIKCSDLGMLHLRKSSDIWWRHKADNQIFHFGVQSKDENQRDNLGSQDYLSSG